ncbi:winged helix-turn-helix domain-containing protein [Amycolatopsis rhizosphaerae]|uniref:GntR family transcriptional regulator n=1 Tax=Amycolatopsis rhizosphaerae TaxID=2053003 RepID=UPI001FE58B1A|nr:winged helix-turn-helix domain-containing protein [Amycolatopsis rhizosphaerae]
MQSDRNQPGYVYLWLAEQLTDRIASGNLPPDAPLPNERTLATEYGVSLGTARHATRILRERGLVITLRSKGSYVARRNEESASR